MKDMPRPAPPAPPPPSPYPAAPVPADPAPAPSLEEPAVPLPEVVSAPEPQRELTDEPARREVRQEPTFSSSGGATGSQSPTEAAPFPAPEAPAPAPSFPAPLDPQLPIGGEREAQKRNGIGPNRALAAARQQRNQSVRSQGVLGTIRRGLIPLGRDSKLRPHPRGRTTSHSHSPIRLARYRPSEPRTASRYFRGPAAAPATFQDTAASNSTRSADPRRTRKPADARS